MSLRLPSSVLSFALFGLLACGDEAPHKSHPDDAGVEQSDAGVDGRPVYLGATRVFSPEGSTGYMFAVHSLDKGTEVELGESVELKDAWVFGADDPYFYTATLFEPSITRWELKPDGTFVQHEVVNFMNEGVAGTYTAAFTPLFAQDKSYFVDSASAQVVVWNPSDMTFLRTIPIELEDQPGMVPDLSISIRHDRILVSVFWASESSGWTKYGAATELYAIDPNTDTVIETSRLEGCETLSPSGVTSDGTTYYSPWDYHAAVRKVYGADFGSTSCAARVASDSSRFDPTYKVDLSTLTGGRPAGGMTLISDDTVLLHVFNAELSGATPETWGDERFSPAYTWYRWKLGEDAAEELPDQLPSGEGGEWKQLDGKTVTLTPNEAYSATTLYTLEQDGSLAEGLTIPGWIAQMIRLR